jgi:hypothetical protein
LFRGSSYTRPDQLVAGFRTIGRGDFAFGVDAQDSEASEVEPQCTGQPDVAPDWVASRPFPSSRAITICSARIRSPDKTTGRGQPQSNQTPDIDLET